MYEREEGDKQEEEVDHRPPNELEEEMQRISQSLAMPRFSTTA